MKIYITHCSAKKDDLLANTNKEVYPAELYRAKPTLRFIGRCVEKNVPWAIFSDCYGIWLANEKHCWYGDDVGDPNRVSEKKFQFLLNNFDARLAIYDQIYFYRNPGRFHQLYNRLVEETVLKPRIVLISHLAEIV